jgi:PAS domain S-box-containing protein
MNSSPKTLLLVEDEALIGLAESKALTKEGYSVIHVLSGEEAVARVKGESGGGIDLILMDIDLGGGIDGTQAARQILMHHEIPVVFLSSHTQKEIVDKTEKITNYGYIVKNLENTVLFAAIKMAFRLHQAHRRIEESEGRFRDLIENIQEGISLMDEDDNFVFANPVAHSIFGVGPGGLAGEPLAKFVDARNAAIVRGQNAIRRRGERSVYEQEIVQAGGAIRKIRIKVSPQFDHKRRFKGSFAVFEDITDEEREHEKLRESEGRYRSLFEDSSNAIVEEDFSAVREFVARLEKSGVPDLRAYFVERPDELIRCAGLVRIVRTNKEYLKIVGAESEEDIHPTLAPYMDWDGGAAEGFRDELLALAERRLPFEREFPNDLLSSDIKWVKLRMSVVPGHEEDWSRVLVSFMDITEQKRVEDQLDRAGKEKDFLMRELEHRVKNNLNIISSLLCLDSQRVTDQDSKRVLADAQLRIESIALFYEVLSHSARVDRLNSADYVNDLVRLLRGIYANARSDIRIDTAIDSFELDVKECVPIGLIVNELFVNAIKYAFPSARAGRIAVELRKTESAELLCVRDDGVGLPPGFDWRVCRSFGLQLVDMLSTQLGGTMTISGDAGVAVTISMPPSG